MQSLVTLVWVFMSFTAYIVLPNFACRLVLLNIWLVFWNVLIIVWGFGIVVPLAIWLETKFIFKAMHISLRPPLFGLQIPENHFAMDSWESAVALDSWESESDCLFTLLFVSFRSCGCCEMSVTPSSTDYDVYMQIKAQVICFDLIKWELAQKCNI